MHVRLKQCCLQNNWLIERKEEKKVKNQLPESHHKQQSKHINELAGSEQHWNFRSPPAVQQSALQESVVGRTQYV